ncbi:type II toxin-antitoxin system RelE/ParE family toxin [Patescibacteria group bacterium]|nr:type II toxin-antitoxin system RelE/ParE family toxin [Patescibacteria group bacterium]
MPEYTCIFYEAPGGKLPAEEFIKSLDEDTQDKFIYKKELLEIFGHKLRFPHTANIGEGIFELRFRGKEGQIRVLFFFFYKRKVVLTHGFVKKTKKTPKKESEITMHRKREFLKIHKED